MPLYLPFLVVLTKFDSFYFQIFFPKRGNPLFEENFKILAEKSSAGHDFAFYYCQELDKFVFFYWKEKKKTSVVVSQPEQMKPHTACLNL